MRINEYPVRASNHDIPLRNEITVQPKLQDSTSEELPRLCSLCNGPRTYEREGDGTYLCAKLHSGNPHEQPSEEWLRERNLEPV